MSTDIQNCITALYNIFLFLPYFFSVRELIRTLFSPWKRIIAVREKTAGLSLQHYFEDIFFDIVSRSIGFVLRLTLLATFALVEIVYILVIPLILLGYIIFWLPVKFILSSFTPSELVRKEAEKQKFLSSHSLTPETLSTVDAWYERMFARRREAKEWWDVRHLLATPPLARDWSAGYTPYLDQYADDITLSAYAYDKRPMTIGREREMEILEQTLSKEDGANIILIGEEGVGKKTIIESFAYRIWIGKSTPILAYKRILTLHIDKALAQETDVKKREVLLQSLFDEAELAGNIILVIFAFDTYLASSASRVDLTTTFEHLLTSKHIHLIGVTTPTAYEKYIYPKTNITRYTTPLHVHEITSGETLAILLDHCHRYEDRYHVTIPYETLIATVNKSEFFLNTIPFPEKSLQLLDDACVYCQSHQVVVVTPDAIDIIITALTHVPSTLNDDMRAKLVTLEQELNQRVVGQPEALSKVAHAMERAFVLLGKRKKPLATFLFLGPTGVGKTETAKALNSIFFATGENNDIVRFDMAQYQSRDDVRKLLGDTTTGEPGLLVEAIREKSYGVLLLDEIEKADHDLIQIFLTLFDEGYLTDSTGKRVDCRHLVVIATSNAGAVEFYMNDAATRQDIVDFLIRGKYFSPEFLNRFDGVIAYEPLTSQSATTIARGMMNEICKSILALHKVNVTVSDATLAAMIARSYKPEYGARNIQRILNDEVETIIAEKILKKELKEGDSIVI